MSEGGGGGGGEGDGGGKLTEQEIPLYRILKPGETIQTGDEWWSSHSASWLPTMLQNSRVGADVGGFCGAVENTYRRRIEPQPAICPQPVEHDLSAVRGPTPDELAFHEDCTAEIVPAADLRVRIAELERANESLEAEKQQLNTIVETQRRQTAEWDELIRTAEQKVATISAQRDSLNDALVTVTKSLKDTSDETNRLRALNSDLKIELENLRISVPPPPAPASEIDSHRIRTEHIQQRVRDLLGFIRCQMFVFNFDEHVTETILADILSELAKTE